MSLKFDFDLNTALARENATESVLRDLRESQPEGMPASITDHQLLLFYVACEKHFEQTRDAIQSYYKYKRSVSSFFDNCDPTSDTVQQCLDNQYYFFLPVTPKNVSIVYARLQNADPSNLFLDNCIKTYLMSIMSCLSSHGPRSGIYFVYDAKDVSLGHLRRISLKSVATYCNFVQQGLPGKLEEIHIINAPWYFDSILSIIRPFLKKERTLFVHGSSTDFTKTFEGKIPRECLPKDLGGNLDTIEELHKQHRERLLKMKNFFAEEEKQWK